MVSENKNIKSLAAENSDEPTSELEVLSVDLIPTDEELEMDADTFAFEHSSGTVDASGLEILRSDLRSKDERISNLQFDIEQLHSRWTGLEKEISAREELTQRLQNDLRSAKKERRSKEKKLTRVRQRNEELTGRFDATVADLTAAQGRIKELEDRLQEQAQQAEQDAATIAGLETELELALQTVSANEELEKDYHARGEELESLRARSAIDDENRDRQTEELATLQARLDESEAAADDLRNQLADKESTYEANSLEAERLNQSLGEAIAREKALSGEVRDLKTRIDQYTNVEKGKADKTIAELQGTLADSKQKIARLESQVIRSESYADDLRDQLTTAQECTSELQSHCETFAVELGDAGSRIADVESELEFEKDRSDTLQTQHENREAEIAAEREAREAEYADTLKSLQGELDTARASLADIEASNEELVANLVDSRSNGDILATQLKSVMNEHDDELSALRNRVEELEAQSEDYESKIESKDSAISALLSELANKSRTLESIDEIENVIHDIDDRMSEKIDDRHAADKDRTSRLLVGKIDGQELRFPLFKNRLTIGRTAQNDIQLRAQHISRRHAVIIVDSDGTKIVDWGSKNGVYINNARISEMTLKSGDTLLIGNAEFVYEEIKRSPE